MVIFGLAFIAVLVNEIPNWVVVKDESGLIDSVSSYPLRTNLIYSSVSILLTVGIGIFVAVFSQIGGFTGKYGSSLMILVPMFVWLFSDRKDNHISHILETIKFLGSLIFWIVTSLAIIFIIATFARQMIAAITNTSASTVRVEMVFNLLNRFNILIINILIIVTLGYTLVNFAVFTLHLADNTPDQISEALKVGERIGPYNLHSENITTYITLITIMFAIFTVLIGLVKNIKKDAIILEIKKMPRRYNESKRKRFTIIRRVRK